MLGFQPPVVLFFRFHPSQTLYEAVGATLPEQKNHEIVPLRNG
jgi:hypothetical protein